MTFEDAIAALGAELGFAIPVENGVATLEAAGAGPDAEAIVIELSEAPDVGGVLLSSMVGELSDVTSLQPLLEANHIFAKTAGATLSIEDRHIYFEQYVPLSAIGRGEGARVVKIFAAHADDWRERIAGAESPNAAGGGDVIDMPSSVRV